MPKRTGTVEQRSGKWWARPTLADGTRGRRVWCKGAKDGKAARAFAEALTKRAQERGITKDSQRAAGSRQQTRPNGPSVAAWGENWLDDRQRRGLSAVRTDRSRWFKWIEPKLGVFTMLDVTTEDLERFVQYLDEQVRAGELHWKTARSVWGLVSKAFDDAAHSKTLELRVRKDNPARDVRPPDEGPARGKQFLYPSEFQTLMACDTVPLRWRELVAVQIYLYCRVGELEALLADDVDIKHRSVHIHRAINRDSGEIKTTKTNNPRRIPIEAALLPLVERLMIEARSNGRDLLVKMPPSHHLSGHLRKYLRRAGIAREELFRTTPTSKQITWHDLRTTAATWLAIRGDAPQMIMARCGHESMATTMGYIRLAAVLHSDPRSAFPEITLPKSQPQGQKEWGRFGGKLSGSLAKAGRGNRVVFPIETSSSVEIACTSAGLDASSRGGNQRLSPRTVAIGAVDGADSEAVAALAEFRRHVAAGTVLADLLDADVLRLDDPADGGAS